MRSLSRSVSPFRGVEHREARFVPPDDGPFRCRQVGAEPTCQGDSVRCVLAQLSENAGYCGARSMGVSEMALLHCAMEAVTGFAANAELVRGSRPPYVSDCCISGRFPRCAWTGLRDAGELIGRSGVLRSELPRRRVDCGGLDNRENIRGTMDTNLGAPEPGVPLRSSLQSRLP